MFEMMRRVFGPAAVTVIVGAIAMVFVFYGVYSPKNARYGSGGIAATVNGDSIAYQEFSREYQQRVDLYQNMMKGKVDAEALKSLGLKRQVLEELVQRKLISQEAARLGFGASDDEVRGKIQEMPYFKKDGKFDAEQYRRVLEANRHSPASFEDTVREDLVRGHVADFLRARARVSEKELEQEFLVSEDRRQVDYVRLDQETAKKLVAATSSAEELAKANRELAKQIIEKSMDPAFVKSKGLEVKPSEKFNRQQAFVPGLGEAGQLVADAFEEPSPLLSAPRMYESRGVIVIARNLRAFKPDLAELAKNRDKFAEQVSARKEQALYQAWMSDLRAKAKVTVGKGMAQQADAGDEE